MVILALLVGTLVMYTPEEEGTSVAGAPAAGA